MTWQWRDMSVLLTVYHNTSQLPASPHTQLEHRCWLGLSCTLWPARTSTPLASWSCTGAWWAHCTADWWCSPPSPPHTPAPPLGDTRGRRQTPGVARSWSSTRSHSESDRPPLQWRPSSPSPGVSCSQTARLHIDCQHNSHLSPAYPHCLVDGIKAVLYEAVLLVVVHTLLLLDWTEGRDEGLVAVLAVPAGHPWLLSCLMTTDLQTCGDTPPPGSTRSPAPTQSSQHTSSPPQRLRDIAMVSRRHSSTSHYTYDGIEIYGILFS